MVSCQNMMNMINCSPISIVIVSSYRNSLMICLVGLIIITLIFPFLFFFLFFLLSLLIRNKSFYCFYSNVNRFCNHFQVGIQIQNCLKYVDGFQSWVSSVKVYIIPVPSSWQGRWVVLEL